MNKQGKTILAIVLLVVAAVVIAWSTGLFGGGGGGGGQVVDPTRMQGGPAPDAPAAGGARQAPGK